MLTTLADIVPSPTTVARADDPDVDPEDYEEDEDEEEDDGDDDEEDDGGEGQKWYVRARGALRRE